MKKAQNSYFVYAAILEPWEQLAISAPGVMHLRMSLLPWLWLTNPAKAGEEFSGMFREKHDAWVETAVAMSEAPLRLWLGTLAAAFSPDPYKAFSAAMADSSHRMAHPSSSRVDANRERLSPRRVLPAGSRKS